MRKIQNIVKIIVIIQEQNKKLINKQNKAYIQDPQFKKLIHKLIKYRKMKFNL